MREVAEVTYDIEIRKKEIKINRSNDITRPIVFNSITKSQIKTGDLFYKAEDVLAMFELLRDDCILKKAIIDFKAIRETEQGELINEIILINKGVWSS